MAKKFPKRMSEEKPTFEFEEGVMWEENPWHIDLNHEVTYGQKCRHSHSHGIITNKSANGSTYYTEKFICPAVVIVKNEGGFNSTGLCLDCLLEAAKGLERNTT